MFYREALGRLLALEKFRNLIETNIEAGITLYTDHKPALFENSLSNKGQLSAWKLAEVSDLLSIVENLYRQGGKMLFADPLSRVCGPTEGWHDPSIPYRVATLLKHLPEKIRDSPKIRLYAGKDTAGVAKILHQWRKPKNLLASSISPGKLNIADSNSEAFHIGVEDVNKVVDLCRNLIKQDRQFAVLIPISIAGEIARKENDGQVRVYDQELVSAVEKLSKIVMAQDAVMWLISIRNHHIDEFVTLQKQMESNLIEVTTVKEAVEKARRSKANKTIASLFQEDTAFFSTPFGGHPKVAEPSITNAGDAVTSQMTSPSDVMLVSAPLERPSKGVKSVLESSEIMLPATRSMAKSKLNNNNEEHSGHKKYKSKFRTQKDSVEDKSQVIQTLGEGIQPVIHEGRIKWKRVPREPIPELSDISTWVGKQLMHKNMPRKYQHMQPKGSLIATDSSFPEGLLAVPSPEGQPRIIVPPNEIKALILQTHEDIHHQNHVKVLHVLKANYYWPNMAKDIEAYCTSCPTCATAMVRRKHLKTKFDLMAPQALLYPRQHYGIDFYGVNGGEILVTVDLFTRETILTYLRNRNQDNVAKALIKNIIFQRGVPLSLRTDNAPELSSITGAVSSICQYLNIKQVKTGGHNPRGNAICERVNQSLGSMIRKLNDYEYNKLEHLALPAFQFALNTTFNSAIGCTPFEAGHGYNATTISEARIMATKAAILAEGGRDGDALEDVNEYFDKSIIKDQFELAMRMAEVARSTSEWHRRMTSENLSQSGQLVNLKDMPVGTKAYIYKPPTQQESIRRGRKVKHIDHYIGPGHILKHIGTRSVVIGIKDENNIVREYQRDAGMVLLKKPMPSDFDPEAARERSLGTRLSSVRDMRKNALKEGEIIILKDGPEAKDWYCAEIRSILVDRVEVNYFTTQVPALERYNECSEETRIERLADAIFLKTWCLSRGKGDPTTTPPTSKYAQINHLWWGKIPMESINEFILIRDVGLDATGKLDHKSLLLAGRLKIPHHQGAGGESDLNSKDTFQKLNRKIRSKR